MNLDKDSDRNKKDKNDVMQNLKNTTNFFDLWEIFNKIDLSKSVIERERFASTFWLYKKVKSEGEIKNDLAKFDRDYEIEKLDRRYNYNIKRTAPDEGGIAYKERARKEREIYETKKNDVETKRLIQHNEIENNTREIGFVVPLGLLTRVKLITEIDPTMDPKVNVYELNFLNTDLALNNFEFRITDEYIYSCIRYVDFNSPEDIERLKAHFLKEEKKKKKKKMNIYYL
jgi:hypothetical protein